MIVPVLGDHVCSTATVREQRGKFDGAATSQLTGQATRHLLLSSLNTEFRSFFLLSLSVCVSPTLSVCVRVRLHPSFFPLSLT
jgi:hypothetical protein